MRYQTVRGTRDILPGEVEAWQRAETLARDVFRRYGFREIRTPIWWNWRCRPFWGRSRRNIGPM